MLCISGFVDDVTFGRNGRDAETGRLHRAATAMSGVAIPGRSLMSMDACFSLFTQRRSVAKSVGCFQRRLFVCL